MRDSSLFSSLGTHSIGLFPLMYVYGIALFRTLCNAKAASFQACSDGALLGGNAAGLVLLLEPAVENVRRG